MGAMNQSIQYMFSDLIRGRRPKPEVDVLVEYSNGSDAMML